MKKTLVASILGLATTLAVVSSSYAQGSVKFDTYNAAVYSPIKYTADTANLASAGVSTALAGTTVGNNFHAALYYGLGNTFTSLSQLTLVPGSELTVGALLPGYITGPGVTIPGYTTGPVTFAVVTWAISGPASGATFATSGLTGQSALWVESSIASGTNPTDTFKVGVPAITVSATGVIIPEPTTLTLAGLGAAALLLRRRK